MDNFFKTQLDAMVGQTVLYEGNLILVMYWKTISTGKIVIHNSGKLIIIPNRTADIIALLEKFSPFVESSEKPPDADGNMNSTVTRNIKIPIPLFAKIEKLAAAENRNFTNMVERLLLDTVG